MVGTDGVNRIQVYSEDGQLLYVKPSNAATGTKYIHLHNHIIAEATGTAVQYDHTDGLGSPVARTDGAGKLISRTRYEPYGATAAGESPVIGYAGHMNAADLGLVYMQQRYYDPGAGRFLSIDPVTTDVNTGSSFSRYAYANNNPYRYVDPDGRNPLLLVPIIGALIGGGINAAVQYESTGTVQWSGVGGVLDAAGDGAMFGMLGLGASFASTEHSIPGTMPTLQANRAAGAAFQNKVAEQLRRTQTGVVQEVTVKTAEGVKTRIDIMGLDAKGNIVCTECKASATAPLTRNQAAAHPQIQQSGAVIVGKGKPGFPGGTVIPPTKVDVVRP